MKKLITALKELCVFRVKLKNQISYEKYALMKSELGLEATDEETVLEIIKRFYPKDNRPWTECLLEFNRLLTEQRTYSISLGLDFENKPAEYFIIADTYEKNSDLVALYNYLSGRSVKDVSVQFAYQVRNEFLQSVSHFKEKYPWIYDPPALPGITKHSAGKILRDDFQHDYGAYAEITYLIAITESKSFNKVNKKPLSEYLSVGEYLLRKRAVESIT